jgi:hypothetical protein
VSGAPQFQPPDPTSAPPRFGDGPAGSRPPAANRRPLIIGGALSVVIAVAVALILVLSGSSGPKGATNSWLAAAQAKDTAKLRDLTCSSQQIRYTADDIPDITGWEISNVSEQGDTAVVTVTISLANSLGTPVHLRLVKENGNWKVCN